MPGVTASARYQGVRAWAAPGRGHADISDVRECAGVRHKRQWWWGHKGRSRYRDAGCTQVLISCRGHKACRDRSGQPLQGVCQPCTPGRARPAPPGRRAGLLKHRPKSRRVQGASVLPMVCNLQLVLKLHIVITARPEFRCGAARGEQLEQANIKPPVRDSWSTSRSPTPALENTSEVTRASVRS